MIVPVHVAHTLANGTFSALAQWGGSFIIEIGASDRNTADVELLPRMQDAFLVTAEPLLEKAARAIGRRRPANRVKDVSEPLGLQHDRGLVLPIAIGPTSHPHGEMQTFYVGGIAGCSSLANLSATPASFADWCRDQRLARQVWTQPLSRLLQQLPWRAHVKLVKIDAQGYDLKVIESAGQRISTVEYVAMEVVSDDCRPIYAGQPQCSTIVAQMTRMGFRPLGEVPCRPKFQRVRMNACELDIVFQNARMMEGPDQPPVPRVISELHNIRFNGCSSMYFRSSPVDRLHIKITPPWSRDYYGPGGRKDNTTFGKLYACPGECAHGFASELPCPW